MHVLTRIVWLVFSPANIVILVFAAGMALCWTSRFRAGRILASIAAGAGLLMMLLPLDQWLARPLEAHYLRPSPPPRHVDGILILGGIFYNVVEGASVARRYPDAKVVYSDGAVYLFDSENSAPYMAEMLKGLGVDPHHLVIEDRSQTTFENILFSQAMIKPKKGQVWLLIASAVHMTRAKAVADHLGWHMTPWPSENIADASQKSYWLFNFATTSYNLGRVVHEYEALLAYRLEGKIDSMSP